MPADTLPAPKQTKSAKAAQAAEAKSEPAPAAPEAPKTSAPPPTPEELSASRRQAPIKGPGLVEVLALINSGVPENEVDKVWAEKGGAPVDMKPETTVEVTGVPKTEAGPAAKSDTPITAESTDADLEKNVADATRDMDPGRVKAFRSLTFENRAQKRELKQVAEMKAKIAELESRAPVKDESAVAALQKKLESLEMEKQRYETELGGVNIKKTQMWRDEVETPRAEVLEGFKEFAEFYQVPAESIIEVAALKGTEQDDAFDNLTAGWAKRKVDRLGELLDKHSAIAKKGASLEAGGKQRYDAWIAQQKEQEALSRAKAATERSEALSKVWSESVESVVPFLKEKEGNAEWNESLGKTRNFVNQADDAWFLKQPVAERVRLTAQAAAYPMVVEHYRSELAAQLAEVGRLTSLVKEMRGASPSVSAGTQVDREPQSQADKDKNLTFSERIAMGIQRGEFAK